MHDLNEGSCPGKLVQEREAADAGPDAGLATFVPSDH